MTPGCNQFGPQGHDWQDSCRAPSGRGQFGPQVHGWQNLQSGLLHNIATHSSACFGFREEDVFFNILIVILWELIITGV